MHRIIDGLAAPEGPLMLADDLGILPAFQSIRRGPDLYWATDCTGVDRVAVVVETHEAGLGNGCRNRMESIKRSNIRYQTGALFFEHCPDCLVPQVWVFVCLGIGDTAILKPSVELGIGFELQAWHKEPPPDHPHLVRSVSSEIGVVLSASSSTCWSSSSGGAFDPVSSPELSLFRTSCTLYKIDAARLPSAPSIPNRPCPTL